MEYNCKRINYFKKIARCGILLFLFFTSHLSFSQNYIGFETGNFSGAIGADANPAFVADNIYKFDLVIVGATAFFENNYENWTRDRALFNFSFGDFKGVIPRNNDVKYAYTTDEVKLPSVLYTISPLEGIAFSPKLRLVANADNFTPDLINAISDEFDNPGNFGENFLNQGGSFDVMSWQEYALSYGRVLQFKEDHYFKGGISLKGLLPMASTYGFLNSLSYISTGNDSITLTDVQFEFSNSANIDAISDGGSFSRAKGVSFGLDLGIVYENRPQQRSNPTYSNGRDFKSVIRNDRPYRYRLSASLLDIGRLKFNHGTNGLQAGGILDSAVAIQQTLRGIGSVEGYIDSISTILNVEQLDGKYTMGLPTRLRLEGDINLHRGFYLNIASELSLRAFKLSDRAVHNITSIAVTPRFENDIFGAYLPVYVNIKGQANIGLALRAGPLVVGVHDILPIISRKSTKSFGAYVVLKTFAIKKNKIKEELKCDDLYDGWRTRKRGASRRANKNVGDSPKVNGQ